MKKLSILTVLLLSACANDWSSSGIPDIYEGQTIASVKSSLAKNNWQILHEETYPSNEFGILAKGKPTKQFEELFAKSCRAGAFIFKNDRLQFLETRDCDQIGK